MNAQEAILLELAHVQSINTVTKEEIDDARKCHTHAGSWSLVLAIGEHRAQ
jgi:hypothetical protein